MVEISMYGSERAPGAVPRCYSRVLIDGEPVPAGKIRHLGPNDIVTLGLTTLLFVDAYMQRLLVRGA